MTASARTRRRQGTIRDKVVAAIVRVATYTRQSVASDSEFGSIAAQREAVLAFIRSQAGSGWQALPEEYNDHGFSGASTDRPAFQRLMRDVRTGKIDHIACYKIDRFSQRRYGGLSGVAQRRLDELIAEIDLPAQREQRRVTGKLAKRRKPGEPKPGTTITRTWRGGEIVLHVRENGFEHDGVLYRSLSAVAKAITGSHLSGRAFFGLTKRKEPAR